MLPTKQVVSQIQPAESIEYHAGQTQYRYEIMPPRGTHDWEVQSIFVHHPVALRKIIREAAKDHPQMQFQHFSWKVRAASRR